MLTLLEERTFAAREFHEARNGVVRLMPPLPQALAALVPKVAQLAAPVVEQVAQRLAGTQGACTKQLRIPTLLSEANRSAGRDGVRYVPKNEVPTTRPSTPNPCRDCGTLLEKQGRKYCDECLPAYRDERAASFSDAGRRRMAELRAAGKDPSKGGEAAKRRGAKNSQWMKDQAAWESVYGSKTYPEVFLREILPHLQGVSLGVMAKATALSEQYCSQIRRGQYVPHQRHWMALSKLPLARDPRHPRALARQSTMKGKP